MRKEPILFAAVAVLAGWYAFQNLGAGTRRTSEPRTKSLEYTPRKVLDVSRVRAPEQRSTKFGRDLFTPPRDTAPLPLLELAAPPLEPLEALFPPTAFGPAPRLHAQFLRTPAPAPGAQLVAGLFDEIEAVEVETVGEELDPRDPAQRAARIAGFKKQYDWVLTNEFHFGQIRNADRYTLDRRPNEPIEFFEVDPATGKGRFNTDQSIEYARERVQELGFAETAANELELGRVQFGDSLTPTDFERALRFADRCIELRNEAPRGIALAEEMYRLAQAINLQQDSRPQLGLARCYELGFRFEDAFEAYESLLEGVHATNPRVHARIGELRARLRMDERAEADFRTAVQLGGSDWETRWRFGRYLLDRGRFEEALAQLTVAVENEPRGEDEVSSRVKLRTEHAAALLANGRVDEAADRFARAIAADLDDTSGWAQVALAGAGAAALLGADGAGTNGGSGAPGAVGAGTPLAGFELLLTQGIAALRRGDWAAARASLELARRADPFLAHLALGALSFLAESAGYPEEAFTFVEEAFDAHPVDPWILYQRGRLLMQRGDLPGAIDSFRGALDRELEYLPAIEELASILHDAGDYEGAERYFERALELDPSRATTWSRRGFNHVRLGDVEAALGAFQRARAERPGLSSASIGLAWVSYMNGDTQEAETLFAQLVDDRRNEPPSDPVRAFAEAQGARIRDHEGKEVWRDRFDRQAGRVQNDWRQEEGVGPESLLRDGAVVIEGQLDRKGRTRVFQELAPERFLSFFVDLTVLPASQGTTNGVFLSVERGSARGGQSEVTSEIVIARDDRGVVRARVRKNASDDGVWRDAPASPSWPVGEPVRVGISRTGDETKTTFTLYVGGEPVFTGLEADAIDRSRQAVFFGVFSEGDPGRRSALRFDDAEVIRRR